MNERSANYDEVLKLGDGDIQQGMKRFLSNSPVEQIKAKVRMVVADEKLFGVLSTGEKCAVALVLNRPDLMKWWGTALDCADRVGTEWLKACVHVQRDGWDE